MKLAFILYKYFPFGGLQKDFINILTSCQKRGHEIVVYTISWDGNIPNNIKVIIIPVKAYTNHNRNKKFYAIVKNYIINHPVDIIIGFNKMPGLDVYFAADNCYVVKTNTKMKLYKLTQRYKHYVSYEKAVFNIHAHTKLLILTQKQLNDFQQTYNTPIDRFYILPPGVDINKKYNHRLNNDKFTYRNKNYISKDQFCLLQVGSDFKRKGVNRTLKSIINLPDSIKYKIILIVIGEDDPTIYQRLAKKNHIDKQVRFFSGRNDISELMFAADLLIHPAYEETAGIVLIEAIVAGLPVITTEVCGYSLYIKKANCGIIINEPYKQQTLNNALKFSITNKSLLYAWKKSANNFADTQDLYSLSEKAADIILANKNN